MNSKYSNEYCIKLHPHTIPQGVGYMGSELRNQRVIRKVCVWPDFLLSVHLPLYNGRFWRHSWTKHISKFLHQQHKAETSALGSDQIFFGSARCMKWSVIDLNPHLLENCFLKNPRLSISYFAITSVVSSHTNSANIWHVLYIKYLNSVKQNVCPWET